MSKQQRTPAVPEGLTEDQIETRMQEAQAALKAAQERWQQVQTSTLLGSEPVDDVALARQQKDRHEAQDAVQRWLEHIDELGLLFQRLIAAKAAKVRAGQIEQVEQMLDRRTKLFAQVDAVSRELGLLVKDLNALTQQIMGAMPPRSGHFDIPIAFRPTTLANLIVQRLYGFSDGAWPSVGGFTGGAEAVRTGQTLRARAEKDAGWILQQLRGYTPPGAA